MSAFDRIAFEMLGEDGIVARDNSATNLMGTFGGTQIFAFQFITSARDADGRSADEWRRDRAEACRHEELRAALRG